MKISRIWMLNLAAVIILIIIVIVGRYKVSPPKKEIKPVSGPSKIIVPGMTDMQSRKPAKPDLSPRQKRKDGISPEEEWTNIKQQMKVYLKDKDDERTKTAIKEMGDDLDKQIETVKREIERNPDKKSKKLLLKDLERLKKTLSEVK